jgi:hypothetical protein
MGHHPILARLEVFTAMKPLVALTAVTSHRNDIKLK